MAEDHKPMRMLLMKLYKKEMECPMGSPERGNIMLMIKKARNNIGLDGVEEGFMDNVKGAVSKVTDKVAGDFKRRKQLFGKGKQA